MQLRSSAKVEIADDSLASALIYAYGASMHPGYVSWLYIQAIHLLPERLLHLVAGVNSANLSLKKIHVTRLRFVCLEF
jgi:hypothetical protein